MWKRWGTGVIAESTLLAEAAAWHERIIDTPDRAARNAFEAWRSSSDEHARAYEQVFTVRRNAASLAGEPAILALRHEAVTRAMFQRRPARAKRMIALTVLTLAGAPLAAFGISHWVQRPVERPVEEVFRTDVGQQAKLILPDGSRVTLDTASQLRIAFTDAQRKVVLEGQAWFELKGSSRPFTISAGDRILTADEGSFDVRTDPGLVRVLAMDGRAAVRPTGTDDAPAVTLEPGRMLAVHGSQTSIRRPENPSVFTSWRDGLVQFDNVRLSDAVGELNRYRRQPIRIADDRAAAVRISGSFRTAETPAFVDALTIGFPVRVKQEGNAEIIIASR